jgi:hypothetical protein
MDLLITDVTEMGGGTYCVAGWDVSEKRMARPLPNGSNWSLALLEQHGVVAGKLIRADSKGLQIAFFHIERRTPQLIQLRSNHRTRYFPIGPEPRHRLSRKICRQALQIS